MLVWAHARVAQLVEHFPEEEGVAGSSPAPGTKSLLFCGGRGRAAKLLRQVAKKARYFALVRLSLFVGRLQLRLKLLDLRHVRLYVLLEVKIVCNDRAENNQKPHNDVKYPAPHNPPVHLVHHAVRVFSYL